MEGSVNRQVHLGWVRSFTCQTSLCGSAGRESKCALWWLFLESHLTDKRALWSQGLEFWGSFCPDLGPPPVTQVPLSHTWAIRGAFLLFHLPLPPPVSHFILLSAVLPLFFHITSCFVLPMAQEAGDTCGWCLTRCMVLRESVFPTEAHQAHPSGFPRKCYLFAHHLPPLWASLPHLTSDSRTPAPL